MRLKRMAAGRSALALLLMCLFAMPLYGADRLQLKKDWQQPGAKTQGEVRTPQADSGGLKLKKDWQKSGNAPKPNTDGLKLKSDWKKPSGERGSAPAVSSGGLKLKKDWQKPGTGAAGLEQAPLSKSGGLQLKGDWKKSK